MEERNNPLADTRILVIRFSAIGDVAMSVHAVRALRRDYPYLKITVVTLERLKGFFDGIEGVDFLFLPKGASLRDLHALIRQCRQLHLDYVADIQNNLRSTLVRWALRSRTCKVASYRQMTIAKWRIKRRSCKRLLPVRNNVLRFCDVFARLGLPVADPVVEREVRPLPAVFGTKSGMWAGVAPFSRKMKKDLSSGQLRRAYQTAVVEVRQGVHILRSRE
jgi:ADP-heptose:LPS heptosyltransferase